MTNQLEMFLNSRVGKRLMKIAKKEQAEFDNAMAIKKSHLDVLKEHVRFATFGSMRDTSKLILVEGVPSRMVTNDTSHVTHLEPITAEAFKTLNAFEMSELKNLSSVAYQKLKYGKNIEPTSDHYYNLAAKAEEGICAEVFTELVHAPTEDSHPDTYMQYYDSVEHYLNKIPNSAIKMMQIRSEANVIDTNREILVAQKEIEECIATQEIEGISLLNEQPITIVKTMEGDQL